MKILFSEIAETGEPGETNQIVFVPYDKIERVYRNKVYLLVL